MAENVTTFFSVILYSEKKVVTFSSSEMDYLQTEWQSKRNEFFSKIYAPAACYPPDCQDPNVTDDVLAQ